MKYQNYRSGTVINTYRYKPKRKKRGPVLGILLLALIGLLCWLAIGEDKEAEEIQPAIEKDQAVSPEVKTEEPAIIEAEPDAAESVSTSKELLAVAEQARNRKQKHAVPSFRPTTGNENGEPENKNDTDFDLHEMPDLGPIGPGIPEKLPKVVSGKVVHSLYGSFAGHFDTEDSNQRLLAEQLAAHFKRLFFFDINFKKELRPGDPYTFIWERSDQSTDGLRILAARFYSRKQEKTYEAYYFKDPQEKYARHYGPDGLDVQRSLKNSPIPQYEQVTSLLHDRRPRHLGIDFKAPVGEAILLPYDAVVINVQPKIQRRNGRWIKVRYNSSGLHALFLHLDSIDPSVVNGIKLYAGAKLGGCGNTGRSTAPHLHYQVQTAAGRVKNPYDIHGSVRKSVSAKAMPDFKATMQRLISLMPDIRSGPEDDPNARP